MQNPFYAKASLILDKLEQNIQEDQDVDKIKDRQSNDQSEV
jgi:hypothetical protein